MKAIFEQHREMKNKYPESIVLFRCGDFYETFDEDAKTISHILGITLTKRNGTGLPMAGFPSYMLDTFLPKLIRKGEKVAITDPVND